MENDDPQGVMLPDLIEQLHEVPAPPPVSMWPQTWGWLVIGIILLGLAGYYAWRRYRHYRANAYRREALTALAAAGNDAATIATIVRRTALSAYPRDEVAALSGDAWVDFLASHSGKQTGKQGFDQKQWQLLVSSPYCRPDRITSDTDFNALARQWVQSHETGVVP